MRSMVPLKTSPDGFEGGFVTGKGVDMDFSSYFLTLMF
jgi:hypothetical protein